MIFAIHKKRLVLVKHHEEKNTFLLHVPPLPLRRCTSAQSPLPADHQGSQQTTVHILHMGWRVIFVLHIAQKELNRLQRLWLISQ